MSNFSNTINETSELLEKDMVTGVNSTGDKFKREEVFVPEVVIAVRAMNRAPAAEVCRTFYS